MTEEPEEEDIYDAVAHYRENHQVETHIRQKELERDDWLKFMKQVEALDLLSSLKESTMAEIRAKVSSRIAQCEISIRDHQKLLK